MQPNTNRQAPQGPAPSWITIAAVLSWIALVVFHTAANTWIVAWSEQLIAPISEQSGPRLPDRNIIVDRVLTIPEGGASDQLVLAGDATGQEMIEADDVLEIALEAVSGERWQWEHDFGSADRQRTEPIPPVLVPPLHGTVMAHLWLTDLRPPHRGVSALFLVLRTSTPPTSVPTVRPTVLSLVAMPQEESLTTVPATSTAQPTATPIPTVPLPPPISPQPEETISLPSPSPARAMNFPISTLTPLLAQPSTTMPTVATGTISLPSPTPSAVITAPTPVVAVLPAPVLKGTVSETTSWPQRMLPLLGIGCVVGLLISRNRRLTDAVGRVLHRLIVH